MIYHQHLSILKKEFLDFFQDKNFLVDMTFGGGGHSLAFLAENSERKVIAFDQDADAIKNGLSLREQYQLQNRLTLVHANFSQSLEYLKENHIQGVDAIFADIGVSSHQFDEPARGFSFREDGPLDMRMDQRSDLRASDIINNYIEEDLANGIYQYGEERYSRKIARRIIEARKVQPILTTKQLEEIVFLSYPPHERHRSPHPATRTFQALRLMVNGELEVLEKCIGGWIDFLSSGGRLGIISFHSLEDRIVKHQFKNREDQSVKVLTKKPIIPSDEEINSNSRSRSAKLRLIEKI